MFARCQASITINTSKKTSGTVALHSEAIHRHTYPIKICLDMY